MSLYLYQFSASADTQTVVSSNALIIEPPGLDKKSLSENNVQYSYTKPQIKRSNNFFDWGD